MVASAKDGTGGADGAGEEGEDATGGARFEPGACGWPDIDKSIEALEVQAYNQCIRKYVLAVHAAHDNPVTHRQ